jgi:hypothetical protein
MGMGGMGELRLEGLWWLCATMTGRPETAGTAAVIMCCLARTASSYTQVASISIVVGGGY